MYFSEVDIRKNIHVGQMKSTDDVSSGYSSGEVVYAGQTVKMREGITRSSSLSSPRPRSMRITRSTAPKKNNNQISESEEELFDNVNAEKFQESSSSSSDREFRDCMDDDEEGVQEQKVPSLTPRGLQLLYENNDHKRLLQTNTTTIFSQKSRSLECMTVLETPIKDAGKRAGKYKKKVAPLPPPSPPPTSSQSQNKQGEIACLPVPIVTGTLVLKPGEMRALGGGRPSSDNLQTPNIFVCHSPKVKRRGKSLSSRTKSSFNRLLPKKLMFWHHKSDTDLKTSPEETNRSSWSENSHRFLGVSGLGLGVKLLSKSDNNLKTNNDIKRISSFCESTTSSSMPTDTDSD